MLIIFTFIAIGGAIYVAYDNALMANILWSISNMAFIIYNILISEHEMVLLFMAYEIICVYGVWNLGRKKNIKIFSLLKGE